MVRFLRILCYTNYLHSFTESEFNKMNMIQRKVSTITDVYTKSKEHYILTLYHKSRYLPSSLHM